LLRTSRQNGRTLEPSSLRVQGRNAKYPHSTYGIFRTASRIRRWLSPEMLVVAHEFRWYSVCVRSRVSQGSPPW
jgi:hypothetical protein